MKHIYLYLLVIFAVPGILFAGEQEWIPLSSYDKSPVEVNVTQASDNLIEITYKLAGFTKNEIEIDGESYSLIGLPGEPVFLEKGLPELPKINRSVLIPARAKMVAKVTHYEVEEFHNINVAPSKGNLPRRVNPDDIPYWFETFYSTDSWFPEEITITHDPYILRDARGMVVEVHPFQYNPIQKVLRVYKNITVQIENVGIDNINVLDIPLKDKESVVKDFLTIYERRFINFPSLRYDLVPEVGTMLIITADEYYDEIVPLVNWKLQKGIPTVVKTISEIGGNNQTNIQNEIQYQYDNNNLAFVLLVGDADDVAPKNVKYDPLYVLLDGNDHYPDAFISRFCANYPSDVANQVNRSIRYERDVAELGGDWYSKGVGIASSQGPGDDGEYDYQHLRNIRTLLLNYNYILVDELYDGSQGGADAPGNPTPTDVANSVNAGRSFINYTGHGSQTSWGSSGFSNSNIDQLSNGFMMPFIFSVACNNGEFHTGECFGEHWLKAGTTDNPRGAIAFYGSTISQSWNPPMEAQDECTDLLVSETALTFGGLCFNGACSMMDQYGYSGQSEYDAWTIFGDASIQIKTLTGEEMTVIHNPIIPLGSTTYDVEVVDVEEALVSLYMNGELYGYGYTDENGEVTIELIEDLTEPGIMTLTVTAYNKIPYIVELDAIVPVQVILSPDTIQVNQQIEIQVTVLDNEGVEPEVGVNVWAKGLGYETEP
ncbi:MAG: C25 family cysteine peptidase, partial [Candidatus Cloacimonadia bacterium]